MAARIGAGTGVIVSLVVFVMTTIFLLILTIVFYAGKTKIEQESAEREATLERFVTMEQRNSDGIKAYEARANPGRNESVVQLISAEKQDVVQWLAADPDADLGSIQGDFQRRFNVNPEAGGVRNRLTELERSVQETQGDLDGANRQLQARQDQIDELNAQLATAADNNQREIESLEQEFQGYRDNAEVYRERMTELESDYQTTVDTLEDQYVDTIEQLENEKDGLSEQKANLEDRVSELQQALSRNRLRGKSPEELVDGRVIETGANNQVFINLGRAQHVVLGMTFEVYGSAASIGISAVTGEMTRGKASIEVVRVGPTSSTCRTTRTVPGRPVVSEDVISNAVYDPDYKFKFMVHGLFDMDGDGRPSEAEAEFVRSRVIAWGGEVVTGDSLPGDLDFLVLGVEPQLPPDLRIGATDQQTEDWLRRRDAFERYSDLKQQAMAAQIPWLNHNRFLILTGHTNR